MRGLQKLALCTAIVAACGGPQPGMDAGETGPGDARPDAIPTDNPAPRDTMSMPDADMPDTMSMPDADMPDTMSMPDSSPDVACPSGQSACGMICVDPQTDNMNCGACGNVCVAGQTCIAGVCTCPTGQSFCSGACVNTQTDSNNCGACGAACPAGQSCRMGSCRIDCAAPRTVCGTGVMMTCVDTQTDVNNCGMCGRSCPMGQSCVAGACVCPMGQTACGMPAMCVDTRTDEANCGGCGRACGMGQTCLGGVCTCPMGETICPSGGGPMSTCRNLQTDNANCGTCGNACMSGRVCAAGMCQASCGGATPNMCGAGAMSFCTNFMTDRANCGSCGNACGTNANCTTGMCRPTNDTPTTAISLPYEINTRRVVTGSTLNAANDAGVCTGSNNTVYYRIDILTRSIVYVETFGSTINTIVGFRTTTTGASTSCNDNACGSNQSQSAIVADVGALYIEIGNAMGAAGAFTFRYTIQPAGGGDVTQITPSTTVQTLDGTTMGGTNGVAQSCGSMTSAPEDTFYFFTCPADPARAFHASSCGSSYDTLIEARSVGVAVTCNDDAGSECGLGSSVTANIPAGAGLHVVYMDGFSSTSSGAYRMQYVYGCNNGFTSCNGQCVQYSTFIGSTANCGACNNMCPAGQSCTNGACGPVPDNTFPTVWQPITTTAFSGGAAGTMNTDDCPTGQVITGVNLSTDGNIVRSIQPICSTPVLAGTGPSRLSFTGVTNLPVRGMPSGLVQQRRCPSGYALTGLSGRVGTQVNQLQLQCTRFNVTGSGPYAIATASPVVPTTPFGNLTMGATFNNACPANYVVNGFSTRSNVGLDAIALRCERFRVFRANVNTMATSALPLVGVANAMSMSFSDNCPAGQVLAGITVRTIAGGINQLAALCHPYNGLTNAGPWDYSTASASALTLRGTAMGGSTTANINCPSGAGVSSMQVQANTTNSYLGRIFMGCTRLGSDTAGMSTYTNTGGAVVGPGGMGMFFANTCATGQIATGLEIRATANIQQLALRCTPINSI